MAAGVKNNMTIPRYQQIAIEIASKIAKEEYRIGQRIYGRSSIASQYGVSPETARRAFCILSDLGIITSEKGNGMIVKSRSCAVDFLSQFSKRQTIETLKQDLMQSLDRQQQEMETMMARLTDLVSATEHYKSMNPLAPFTLEITAQCRYLNQSIQEMQLWQRTGATLVALKRNDVLLRSPGPYTVLR